MVVPFAMRVAKALDGRFPLRLVAGNVVHDLRLQDEEGAVNPALRRLWFL